MDYYVYILKSLKDGSLYKGFTQDISNRIELHNQGKCPATSQKRPLKLIHVEAVKNRKEARAREQYYKSGVGREKLKKMLG